MKAELSKDVEEFNIKVVDLNKEFEILKGFYNYSNATDFSVKANILESKIREFSVKIDFFNNREKLLKLPITNYTNLIQLTAKS